LDVTKFYQLAFILLLYWFYSFSFGMLRFLWSTHPSL